MMIMAMTGKGDDTAMFRAYVQALKDGITQHIKDPARQKQAQAVTERMLAGFRTMRVDYNAVGKCLENADRRYEATQADYEHCLSNVDSIWNAAVDVLVNSKLELDAAATPEETAAMHGMAPKP
jgi:hypothetical protein